MQEDLIAASRRALVLAAALAAFPAGAIVLGELEVRSALGEALDARIPVGNPDGEMVDATCFSLAREGDATIPLIGEGILTVERTGGAPVLRVRSLARIYEPAVMLRVRAVCPGQSGYVLRQYSVLLDPRPGREIAVAPPLVEARGGAESSSAPQDRARGDAPRRPPAVSAILNARSGDSLRSIASKVFPRNREARVQYLAALREANPAFAGEGDNERLPEGAPIALPDLRTFAGIETRVARRPRERAESVAAAETAAAPQRRSRAPRASGEATAAPQRTAAAPRPSGDAFVLKLSSGEVDLTRSRAIDDRLRAQLRERLLVLDADDQVSALLAMRDSLRKLETRVAELQLKLSAMPPSLAARETTASAAPPAQTRPAASPAAPAAAPSVPPQAAEPPPAAIATPPAPSVSASPSAPQPAGSDPAAATAPAKTEPSAPRVVPREATGGTKPKPVSAADTWRVGLDRYLWGVVALLVALALLLAWRLKRRHQQEQEYEAIEPEFGAEEAVTEHIEIAPEPEPQRAVIGSDAALPPRLQDDSAQLRRRYLEERFPEVVNRTIVLDDPDSVVKGARLFYEDGALPRAVELLQFAIDANPGEVRPWLALFEIFRLERLTSEFADLARRFQQRHGQSEYWPKVQYIGREIDPGNHMYKDESLNKLETIGPAAARRIAAATFDPLAENWLNAPMDFQNQVLANELRHALMTEAAITDQDLVPNPMPALRNTEMYQLA